MRLYQLYQGNCLRLIDEFYQNGRRWDTIFADPPDNIGLGYDGYDDNLPTEDYVALLQNWLYTFVNVSRCVWFSYNVKWWAHIGCITLDLKRLIPSLKIKPCVQFFTFGRYNDHDLGNNHRPLLRLMRSDAPLYSDAIRIPSWRQEHGDKRADPRGRVPGDVFEFPRVTGNSKQRRSWHKTQLHEGLVERCIKMTTVPGERILDPFAGTGTTLRVCKRLDRDCTLLELCPSYCEKIAEEHELVSERPGAWFNEV